jgi:cysteine synthase A
VQSVGSAQCIRGVSGVLRRLERAVRIVAVELAESAALSGGAHGGYKIDGVSPGFELPRWAQGLADEIVPVSTAEAKDMARRATRQEGVFAGTSSVVNVEVRCESASASTPDRPSQRWPANRA